MMERPTRYKIMDCVDEPGGRVNVGERLDVQLGFQNEPPVPLAIPNTCSNSVDCITLFQIRGTEMNRVLRLDGECEWTEDATGVIYGVDGYFSRLSGVIDDSHHAMPKRMGSRWDQRKMVSVRQRTVRHIKQADR